MKSVQAFSTPDLDRVSLADFIPVAPTSEEIFAMPMTEIRKAITVDEERGRDLRQSSPLASLLSEASQDPGKGLTPYTSRPVRTRNCRSG